MRLARPRTTAHLLAAGAAGVLALVLAGCGSGTPASSSTSTTRSHATTSRPGTTTTVKPSTTTSTTSRSSTTTSPPATTSTTTTVPPSTTTTAAVPALVPLAGSTPLYRPSQFNYTQDGTGSVSNITWSTWSSAGATGTGTINLNDCVPNCASGTFTGYPATVTLSGASQTSQGYVFTQMVISAPGSPQPTQTFTIPR